MISEFIQALAWECVVWDTERFLLVLEDLEAPWRGCLSYHNWHFFPSSNICDKSPVIRCFAFFPPGTAFQLLLVSSQAELE